MTTKPTNPGALVPATSPIETCRAVFGKSQEEGAA